MTKHQWERTAAIVVPLLLMTALAITGVWGSKTQAHADALEGSMEDMYRASFYELDDNVNDMQVALKKLLVVSSKQQHILLLSDVWRLSGAAAANLADLPQSHVETEAVTRFVVQSGDYAHSLIRRILDGEIVSDDDREQLTDLYEASVVVARDLADRIERGELPVAALTTEDYYQEQASGSETASPEPTADGGAQAGQPGGEKEEDASSNYPTLIYDGPFSDSTQKAAPQGLPEGEVSEQEATVRALEYLGQGSQLTLGSTAEGTIPAYHFTGTDPDGRGVEIAVSKQGGAVVWMMAETRGGQEGVPDESVTVRYRDAAKAYLDAHGYDGMKATYAQFYAGVAVLNFAATQDGVLLYSDLVKVYVERASEKIVGIDANNYLFSHRQRTLPDTLISEAEARQHVTESMEIRASALAYIPRTASREVLCYEFKGTCRGAEFIVYINAVNGAEEDVFEIINADEGQLVV